MSMSHLFDEMIDCCDLNKHIAAIVELKDNMLLCSFFLLIDDRLSEVILL